MSPAVFSGGSDVDRGVTSTFWYYRTGKFINSRTLTCQAIGGGKHTGIIVIIAHIWKFLKIDL